MIGGYSFAFSYTAWRIVAYEKNMNKKNSFLMDKTQNKNNNKKIKLQTQIGI
jgi:hypothetical protein